MNPAENLAGAPEFAQMVDLVSSRIGGQALATSDEFFAEKENLLKPEPAIFIADKYTEFGKWMDGWESRRKRGVNKDSHDWCVLRLGAPGEIHGVNIDTSFFTGNYPESCSLEACALANDADPLGEEIKWTAILSRILLKGGGPNFFEVKSRERWTHLRLNIFPDGGVARLRVYGIVRPDWPRIIADSKALKKSLDLAAVENGATVVTCNDMFFGYKDNLIMPGRSKVMGDGWETKRKRGIDDASHDWIVIELGHPGKISKLLIDTNHFKGNYPDACLVEAAYIKNGLRPDDLKGSKISWNEMLPKTKLKPHYEHFFESELKVREQVITHLKLKIFPDGGVSRLRAFGLPTEER